MYLNTCQSAKDRMFYPQDYHMTNIITGRVLDFLAVFHHLSVVTFLN